MVTFTVRCACFCLATASAYPQVFEIEGRYWFTKTDAQVRVERLGLATDVDLKKDLGTGDGGFPEAQVTWSPGSNQLRFAFTPIRYSGDQDVNRTIVFGGRTYSLGTRVVSNVDVDALRLTWTHFFLRTERLRLGPLLEANGFLQSATLSAPALSFLQSNSLSVGAPAFGLAAEVTSGRIWKIVGEAAGTPAGRYGYFIRSEAAVKLTPLPHAGITAGYRLFDLHADYQPDFARLRVHGPFVGVSLRF
ncbi:MAG TPA: hypothetical protein VL285_10940 [Bryobacteraceae bacterium]|jgi:hypothetical protein|nr:hypothetical protein [Bryobacteraceae bacterium]